MKQKETYQSSRFPMGIYSGANDADPGKGRDVFNFEEEG